MAANWPTHVAKARSARKAKLRQKRVAAKLRRLHKSGKRGEVA